MGQWKDEATRAVAAWLGVRNLEDAIVVGIGREALQVEALNRVASGSAAPWARHRQRRHLLAGMLQAHTMRSLDAGANEVQRALITQSLLTVDWSGIAEVLLDRLQETDEEGTCGRAGYSEGIGYTSAGPGEAD
jgi:hypothetical protein